MGTETARVAGFLGLPAEIRIQIYEYALTRSKPLEINSVILITEPTSLELVSILDEPSVLDIADIEPNLLRTCRQIYHECASIFYGENTFRVDIRIGISAPESDDQRVDGRLGMAPPTYAFNYPWPLLRNYSSNLQSFTCYAETDKGKTIVGQHVAFLHFLHCIGPENRRLIRRIELYAPLLLNFPRLLPIYAQILDAHCLSMRVLILNIMRLPITRPVIRRQQPQSVGYTGLGMAHLRACMRIGISMLARNENLELRGDVISYLYAGEFADELRAKIKATTTPTQSRRELGVCNNLSVPDHKHVASSSTSLALPLGRLQLALKTKEKQ